VKDSRDTVYLVLLRLTRLTILIVLLVNFVEFLHLLDLGARLSSYDGLLAGAILLLLFRLVKGPISRLGLRKNNPGFSRRIAYLLAGGLLFLGFETILLNPAGTEAEFPALPIAIGIVFSFTLSIQNLPLSKMPKKLKLESQSDPLSQRWHPIVTEVAASALRSSVERIGMLVAFERTISLAPYRDNGISLNSQLSEFLLDSIFYPGAPMHDGGVIVSENGLEAANCIFPLTANPATQRRHGTRHRAAIGLTEENDAVCLVVSEETGKISLAKAGELTTLEKRSDLNSQLLQLLLPTAQQSDPESGEAKA